MKVAEYYGSLVFNDRVMATRLPRDVYRSFKKSVQRGTPLQPTDANIIANAMKDWAVENGATHFTHWFQPMTGITAEKHDSFIAPTGDGGVIMNFSGKELIKGEPDASSFPSGGLRATFEARGYTNWDPTSYAFIKDHTLCIPTAFCSYTGEALDKKTPLLRSMDALSRQAVRVLRLFGDTSCTRVSSTVGAEQEYFLVDKEMYLKRKDLIFCGRTLFGAKPPKGQELDDHYFGSIRPRVAAFMQDLDETLWKLGIAAKTRHNEVAPSQHELAPVFATTNIATDHNQLTMEMMKKVADKHGLACLLHEKPFAGVNGSGKHNNWSLQTDGGANLLEPGDTPRENAQFLLFLAAVIKAVDEFQGLLRVAVATAGNDHRLGANEAPPAIVSVFLGDELTAVLESIETDCAYDACTNREMEIGVDVLPRFSRDTTDRNRTSPFAFTGNKFEFRMVGSSSSIADANIVLNTIAAESLRQLADVLEDAEDFTLTLNALIKETIRKHRRIVFNGNNYSNEWVEEAAQRGLHNFKHTADALPYFVHEENVALFERHHVLSPVEVHSRYEIMLENYTKTLHIEALTMLEMARKNIFPAVSAYIHELTQTALDKKALGLDLPLEPEQSLLVKLTGLCKSLYERTEALEALLLHESKDVTEEGQYYSRTVFPAMQALRMVADELETLVGKQYWPFPTYGDLLFSV
ncbi:MAG TPA: glutamine synthetase III [Clostridia bacterium]|nr:glutamine synthetase III [Clostridia bacterium]